MPQESIPAKICSTMFSGYDLELYKNDAGEVGGYITRSEVQGTPLFQYDATGTLIRRVDFSSASDPAELAKATAWRKELEAKFPRKESVPCRSIASFSLNSAMTLGDVYTVQPTTPPHTWKKSRQLTAEEARQDYEKFMAERQTLHANSWQDTATFLLSAAALLYYGWSYYPYLLGSQTKTFVIDLKYLVAIAIVAAVCIWFPSDWLGKVGKPSLFRKIVRGLGWIALAVPGIVLLLAQ